MISVLYGMIKQVFSTIIIVLLTIVEFLVNSALSLFGKSTKNEKWKFIDKNNRSRTMKNLIHYRVMGHAIFSFILIRQVLDIQQQILDKLPTHPELAPISAMFNRYITIWNTYLQIFYAFVAMTCDVFKILKVDFLIPPPVKKHRYTWAAGVFWPLSCCIFLFWPFYLYRNDLILVPEFRLVLSEAGNFVFHGVSLLFSLWELTFLPKQHPKVRFRSFNLTLAFCSLYTCVLLYTRYFDCGSWPYNFLNYTEDSIIIFVLIAVINMTTVVSYFLQGYVKNFVWQHIGLA